jgi:hypothetical protein
MTTYDNQVALIDLLEFYGFEHTATKADGELVYEKRFSHDALSTAAGISSFETDRLNYPRFIAGGDTRAFIVPIKEDYHDTLYPDLKDPVQPDMLVRRGRATQFGKCTCVGRNRIWVLLGHCYFFTRESQKTRPLRRTRGSYGATVRRGVAGSAQK